MNRRTLSITAHASVIPSREPNWNAGISPTARRKNPRIWQLALGAVEKLFALTPERPRSIIVATALGALDETRCFLDSVFVAGFASPRNFIASVHNSMAGKIATDYAIPGANLTFCEGANSLVAALNAAMLLDASELPVLIVAVEERLELLDKLGPYLNNGCKPYIGEPGWPDGAMALLCRREENEPRVSVAGPTIITGTNPQAECDRMTTGLGTTCTTTIPLSQSSTSFFAPALTLANTLDTIADSVRICSYSPASGSAAILELCP